MGALHAQHVKEIERESQTCRLAAIVDHDLERAKAQAIRLAGNDAAPACFAKVDDLIAAGAADASVVVTPTASHRRDTTALLEAGHRVLLEKPLTGTLDQDRDFAAELDERHPNGVMLAFQRRFDEPLARARDLAQSGAIGRVFKIVSILEDSRPAPHGYLSGGLLADMSVHNVDEILWLTGAMPVAAASFGSRLYSHRLTTVDEDFDDGFLYVWFEGELAAQVQVSRNHVPGYRVETWIFGEEGNIHVGHFAMEPLEVTLEAYSREKPIEKRVYRRRDYGRPVPEFGDRFGPAYKREVEVFVDAVRGGEAFPTSHRDGVRAMEVIAAGLRCPVKQAMGGRVGG